MSLVDLVLPPAREQEKKPQKQGDAAPAPAPTPSTSYTDRHQQPSPKVQSRDSIDSAVYQEFYAPRSHDDDDDAAAPSSSTDDLLPSQKRKTTPMDPPALPQRSALRSSSMLGSDMKLDSQAQTPHDVYLSSEEEASSSADDFSDYDFSDSDADADVEELQLGETELPPTHRRRRRSHEDTARVVSVVFSGRPSIIDVSARRSASSASSERPRTSVASATETRRPSTASGGLLNPHPPRSSSMMVMTTTGSTDKPRPGFLTLDPFPHEGEGEEEDDVPRTPKTPTATVLKSVSRTFSLVKKRSRPLLLGNFSSPSAHNGSTASLHRLERSSHTPRLSLSEPNSPPSTGNSTGGEGEFVLHPGPGPAQAQAQAQAPPASRERRDSSLPLSPLAPPPPPHSPLGPGARVKGILAMARRRSIHIRAAARV